MRGPFFPLSVPQEANESLAIRSKRLVMIRNNTFFSPWLVSSERPLAGRILWTFEFLHLAMTRHNLSFPDTVFYIEARSVSHPARVPSQTWISYERLLSPAVPKPQLRAAPPFDYSRRRTTHASPARPTTSQSPRSRGSATSQRTSGYRTLTRTSTTCSSSPPSRATSTSGSSRSPGTRRLTRSSSGAGTSAIRRRTLQRTSKRRARA